MTIYSFGPFHIDAGRLLLIFEGTPLPLGPKVVETLLALVERPGEVCSKAELLDRIWPQGYVEEANLAQNVYVLRKTLRQWWNADAIATIPRRGYRFSQPVHRLEGAVPAPIPIRPSAPPKRFSRVHAAIASVAAVLALAIGAGTFAIAHRPIAPMANTALSPDGARLYAIGRYYWNMRTDASLQKSMHYFAEVVRTDPRNARGFAALAEANSIMADYRFGTLLRKTYESRARVYALQALAIDDRSAEAHAAMGLVDSNQKRYAAAHREYRHAIALDPTYAPAQQWYGIDLLIAGHSQQAYDELRAAARLDPLAVATASWLSEAAYLSRHYAEAVNYAQQALDLSPQRSDAYESLGLAYEARGQYGRALATYDRFARSCHCEAEAAALRAHVFARMHRFRDARRELDIAQSPDASTTMGSADFEDVAMAFIAMGRRAEALRLMRESKHVSFVARTLIAIDPRMDPVRRDARFKDWTQQPA